MLPLHLLGFSLIGDSKNTVRGHCLDIPRLEESPNIEKQDKSTFEEQGIWFQEWINRILETPECRRRWPSAPRRCSIWGFWLQFHQLQLEDTKNKEKHTKLEKKTLNSTNYMFKQQHWVLKKNVEWHPSGKMLSLSVWCGIQDFYFEEIRVFQAGIRLEYISME